MANTSLTRGPPLIVQPSKSADALVTRTKGTAMTTLTAHRRHRPVRPFFASVIGFCADFCAGARQGGYPPSPRNRPDGAAATRASFAMTVCSSFTIFLLPTLLPVRGPTTDGLFFAIAIAICAIVAAAHCIPLRRRRCRVHAPANLFSVFPENLSARLFANAKPIKLAADEVLFLAGDPGDGCYRVEQGLLKVSMIAPSGAERILAIVGPGAHRRRALDHRRPAALGLGRGGARFRTDLRQPRGVPGLRRRHTRRSTSIW